MARPLDSLLVGEDMTFVRLKIMQAFLSMWEMDVLRSNSRTV
jgi:hypothetical protein